MSASRSFGWVTCVARDFMPSQSRTLAELVAAAICTERPNRATIGRRRAIKRAWRFTNNTRVEVADAMTGVIARLVRKWKKRL